MQVVSSSLSQPPGQPSPVDKPGKDGGSALFAGLLAALFGVVSAAPVFVSPSPPAGGQSTGAGAPPVPGSGSAQAAGAVTAVKGDALVPGAPPAGLAGPPGDPAAGTDSPPGTVGVISVASGEGVPVASRESRAVSATAVLTGLDRPVVGGGGTAPVTEPGAPVPASGPREGPAAPPPPLPKVAATGDNAQGRAIPDSPPAVPDPSTSPARGINPTPVSGGIQAVSVPATDGSGPASPAGSAASSDPAGPAESQSTPAPGGSSAVPDAGRATAAAATVSPAGGTGPAGESTQATQAAPDVAATPAVSPAPVQVPVQPGTAVAAAAGPGVPAAAGGLPSRPAPDGGGAAAGGDGKGSSSDQTPANPLAGNPAPVFQTPAGAPAVAAASLPHATAENILSYLNQGGRLPAQLQLQLDPPALGKMTVHLAVQDGALSVTFVTATSHARDAVAASLPRMRELLSRNNLVLGHTGVFVGSQAGGREAPGGRSRGTAAAVPRFPAGPAPEDGEDWSRLPSDESLVLNVLV